MFANQQPDEIAEIASLVGLQVLQLHGDSDPQRVADVRAATGLEIWAVVRTATGILPDDVEELADAADALLVDAMAPGQLGGTGLTIPWLQLGESLDAMTAGHRIVLAGGLTPENVGEAIDYVSPMVVDVSSGVESAPGIKDHKLVRAFIAAARANGEWSNCMSVSVIRRIGSARSAASTCPRRSCPRSTSSRRRTPRRRCDASFRAELSAMLSTYVGRPSPLSEAPRLSERVGARVLLKREDLNHTGAHKINNTVGQVLLARRMGKRASSPRPGAGQHGVATATVCARFGLECVVYMGEEDMRRQELNVFRMRLMGATVVPVTSGTRTLKDATSEAIRDWVTNVNDTHYIIGSVVGPAPYPRMVRDFQAIIGVEARAQVLERTGRCRRRWWRASAAARTRWASSTPSFPMPAVELIGVEAAGEGLDSERHSASLTRGTPGVLHGALSYLLQDDAGQVHPAHSISAGLDYPGVGPEHSYLKDSGRATYVSVRDDEALEGFQTLSRLEGIIPALESAHAVAWITRERRAVERGRRRPALRERARRQGCGAGDGNGYLGRVTNPTPHLTTKEMERIPAPFERERVEELLRLFGKGGAGAPALPPQQPGLQVRARCAARRLRFPSGSRRRSSRSAFTESEVKWEGETVLEETTRGSDSLPWLFYKDGVREMRMLRGFETEELDKLLGILQRVRKASPDEDDLLTMLWQGDFVFLRYRYVDLSVEASVPLADGGEALAASHEDPRQAVEEDELESPSRRPASSACPTSTARCTSSTRRRSSISSPRSSASTRRTCARTSSACCSTSSSSRRIRPSATKCPRCSTT